MGLLPRPAGLQAYEIKTQAEAAKAASPERRCSSRTFRYGYLVTTAPGFHGLTGGVYKARERIHRAMADARLLANPASRGRVADPCPN